MEQARGVLTGRVVMGDGGLPAPQCPFPCLGDYYKVPS